jgi:hypothetical protein
MRINKEIKELISQWRPTLGDLEDLNIRRKISAPLGNFSSLEKEQKYLIELLKKRLKDGAIRPSAKQSYE